MTKNSFEKEIRQIAVAFTEIPVATLHAGGIPKDVPFNLLTRDGKMRRVPANIAFREGVRILASKPWAGLDDKEYAMASINTVFFPFMRERGEFWMGTVVGDNNLYFIESTPRNEVLLDAIEGERSVAFREILKAFRVTATNIGSGYLKLRSFVPANSDKVAKAVDYLKVLNFDVARGSKEIENAIVPMDDKEDETMKALAAYQNSAVVRAQTMENVNQQRR